MLYLQTLVVSVSTLTFNTKTEFFWKSVHTYRVCLAQYTAFVTVHTAFSVRCELKLYV